MRSAIFGFVRGWEGLGLLLMRLACGGVLLGEEVSPFSGPSGAAAKLGIPSSTLETRIKALKINKQQVKFGERFSP